MQRLHDELTLSPTDLHHFLECRHLTQLELALLREEIAGPNGKRDASADLIARKGDEHEARFLASLKAEGKEVVEIPATREPGEAAAATVAEMKLGTEVIYQSAFVEEATNGVPAWTGYADFLFRVETPSDLGEYSYEVADTKLARRTKPYFLLQLCFYSEQISRIQGIAPEWMHVVLGTNERHRYRVAEFSSYYRSIRDQFVAEIGASPLDTFPMPVDHCGLCRWSDRCDDQRIKVDHLSLVAGMRRDQILRLEDAGIRSLAELGEAAGTSPTPRISQHSYDRLHHQARLQLHYRDTGEHKAELLEPAKRRGLALLPPPNPGDLFFDMEGDPLYENGLEYLFGAITNDTGEPVFHPFWGTDREKEKLAFEAFMDSAVARRKRYPEMHVYHYAQYEVTALKRLMGLHGTREQEVDDLLRNEVFVDLYKVVRQGMRISQPSYSIKKVEVFYMDARDAAVTDGEDSIVAYERYLKTGETSILDAIAAYNEEDCLSTLKLRDWLLERRVEAEVKYGPAATWQEPEGYEPDERRLAEDAEVERLQRALVAGLPEDIAERALLPAERARALMADLLAYHRREDKPAYWLLFARRDMTPDELEEDPEALGNLTRVDEVEAVEDGRSLVYEMAFTPQEHRLKAGSTFEDPAIRRGLDVTDIDNAHGRIWVKRGGDRANENLPSALIPGGPIGTDKQRAALRRVGESIVRDGLEGDGPYRALRDVLARELPRIAGHEQGKPLQSGAFDFEHAKDLASGLDRSYLFIQGPPGSGKTYNGARLILHLIAQGMRVGVTSQSHSAIHELLGAVEEAAAKDYPQLEFHGLHKASDEDSKYDGKYITSSTSNAAVAGSDAELKSGTAWLFSREEMDSTLDYLFIDEAGQFALADALAVGTAARNLVLLGDPLQLPQVTQGRHPEGSDASVLEHLLGENPTVRPERGLFIDTTRRMHPHVTSFISEVVYAGRLGAIEECSLRGFTSDGDLTGTGIRYLPVEHEGNSRCSTEEAVVIADAVRRMLDGGKYTDEKGAEHDLVARNVMVLSPYNAQVQVLGDRLPEGVQIGTVDKFQGREAPVVFFSMTTSSGAELPRNLEFLFSRNRLNVAISRAQCMALLVASPELLRIQCRTVDQMLLVNALCRFVELAELQTRLRADRSISASNPFYPD